MKYLKKKINDDGSVTITWNAPRNFNASNPKYVVEYNGKKNELDFMQTKFVIPVAQGKKSFVVKVNLERLC